MGREMAKAYGGGGEDPSARQDAEPGPRRRQGGRRGVDCGLRGLGGPEMSAPEGGGWGRTEGMQEALNGHGDAAGPEVAATTPVVEDGLRGRRGQRG